MFNPKVYTTLSADIITLQRPSVSSRLKQADRCFIHAPVLWNSLPERLWQPSAPQSLGYAIDSTTYKLALYSQQFHSRPKSFSCFNLFILSLHQLLPVLWSLDL